MIKIISRGKEKIVFETDMDESLANSIRRSVLEIPVLAVDEVEFFKNDSALFDEIIAHRLGLVPLETEKTFTEIEKCSCKGKGCSKCLVDLKIKAKGPCTVYSKDLKGKVKPVYNDIPIVILDKDQELELVARAKLGKGIEHAKYSPGLVYYRNLAKIEISKECNSEECKKCIEACPQNLLKIEKDKIVAKDVYKCDLCEACVEECKKQNHDAIKISQDENLIFFIESWGQIEAKEIFTEAIDALNHNLKELGKQVK